MVEILIICGTVLIIFGGSLWFGCKFFANDKIRLEFDQLKADLEHYKLLVKEDVQTLANNQLKLDERLKKIDIAASMNPAGGTQSLLQGLAAQRRKASL
jgi:hypothetical protein